MVTLRVLGWDDPRGRDPLLVAAEHFELRHPGVDVEVSTRPLSAFEDQPIDEVIRTHDVLCIDHPFIGEAATRGVFVPLEDYTEPAVLEAHRRDAIGPSFASYRWGDRQWAFAMDVACQVSAWRDDILLGLGLAPPDTVQGVLDLARAKPGLVALPLNPIHSSCTFLSLCASATGGEADESGFRVPRDVGVWAVEWLQELARLVHPLSATSDPIEVLDELSRSQAAVAYSPFVFGYSNYARPGYRSRRITFGDVPSVDGGSRGSILGGVGLAISAESQLRAQAVEFASIVAGSDFQRHHLVAAGGQPASRSAWDDADLDERCGGFFSSTRKTTEQAFLRPRFEGFPARQRSLATSLHRLIWDGGSATDAIDSILDGLMLRRGARAGI